MSVNYTIQLNLTPSQSSRLSELQELFAEACNAIGPVVASTRCWNRVALHHLVYRKIRDQFPELGSQLAANAIHSVCRAAKEVFQNPKSKWYVGKNNSKPLPTLKFLKTSPVFFDRHTLSLKGDKISIFTIEGRMRLQMPINQQLASLFETCKLNEIVLISREGIFSLLFRFDPSIETEVQSEAALSNARKESANDTTSHHHYVVEEAA